MNTIKIVKRLRKDVDNYIKQAANEAAKKKAVRRRKVGNHA
jgi:hypothetical protein